ncbi:MAG: hypothetical protein KDE51_22025, partial [Anaerolineales bacterium]|nr:hypothetical protein [Anaerolineales bacterium]
KEAFTAALAEDNPEGRGQQIVNSLRPRLAQLTTLYEQRQFDRPKEPEVAQRHNREARQLWRFLERPLLHLWWQRLFRRKKSE